MRFESIYLVSYLTYHARYHRPFWGMRVGSDSPLASILASSTDRKKIVSTQFIQRIRSRQYPCNSLVRCRVQVWVQVWAPACHLAITPEGCSRRQSVVFTSNEWPSSWGSAPAQLGLVGRASTYTGRCQVDGSRWGQLLGRLRQRCYHSCDTNFIRESKRFSMLCTFWAVNDWFVFHVKWNFQSR